MTSRPEVGSAFEPQLDDATATRRLRNGLISLVLLIVLVAGLLLAVPGLPAVEHQVTHMQAGWLAAGVVLEILSCLGYVLAFLQVFDRAPVRFGARVALSELAFGATVSLGGAGSVAIGAAMWGTIAFLVLRRSRGAPVRLRPPREERRRLRRSVGAARGNPLPR